MAEIVLWVGGSTLGLVVLLPLVLLLVVRSMLPRSKARFRHRQYRVTTRGWTARRQGLRLTQAAEGFRNHHARFLSCMRRPPA